MEDSENAELTAELIAPLADIEAVYFHEDFDSLAQVMDLLADSSPEDARESIDAQLLIANEVFDELVEENHERILENAVRHGEALELYSAMSSGLRQLVAEVDEARRSLKPIAADSLMQLRFKRAMLSEVTGILQSVALLQKMPQEAQELLMHGSIVEASKKVIPTHPHTHTHTQTHTHTNKHIHTHTQYVHIGDRGGGSHAPRRH